MLERKIKPYKPIYRDRVSADQAPAALTAQKKLSLESKISAVVARYEARREQLADCSKTQTTPEQVETHIEDLTGQQAEFFMQTLEEEPQAKVAMTAARREDNVVLNKLWWKIAAFRQKYGRRLQSERQTDIRISQSWLDELEAKHQKIAELNGDLDEIQQDLQTANTYSRGYIDREADSIRLETLIDAQQRGGPLKIGIEMREALKEQKQLRERADFYRKDGINLDGLDIRNLCPQDIALAIEQGFNEKFSSSGSGFSTNEIQQHYKELLVVLHPFIVKIAAELNIEIDLSLLRAAYLQGIKVTECVSGVDIQESWDFVRRKKEKRQISSHEVGYYEMGAFQLDRFCEKHHLSLSAHRIPYVIAYAIGSLINTYPRYLKQHLRDWLADSVPVDRVDPQGNKRGKTSRGFGSMLIPGYNVSTFSYSADRVRGSTDPELVTVLNEATQIVEKIEELLTSTRLWGATQRYRNGVAVEHVDLLTWEELEERKRNKNF
jgi:hypothetical protein